MSVQSVIIDKSMGLQEANKWIKTHGFKTHFGEKPVHVTANKFRYRQLQPIQGMKYRIKKVSPQIEFVMQYHQDR
jgi:hypothetical protein